MSLNACFSLGSNPWFISLVNKLPTKLHGHSISFWYCVGNNSLNLLLKKGHQALKALLLKWSINDGIYNHCLERSQSNREFASNNVGTSKGDGVSALLLTHFSSEHRFVFRNYWQSKHSIRMTPSKKIPWWYCDTLQHTCSSGFSVFQMNNKKKAILGKMQTDFESLFANGSF